MYYNISRKGKSNCRLSQAAQELHTPAVNRVGSREGGCWGDTSLVALRVLTMKVDEREMISVVMAVKPGVLAASAAAFTFV